MPSKPTSMDHKAFLTSLTVDQRQDLLAKSDRAGLLHLAVHWGAILLVGTLIASKVPFWGALIPVQGILIIFNFTLLHECTHLTPFKTPWINTLVGRISGVLVGLPFLWFRYFHLAHHKYTNDPAHDPELVGLQKPNTWPQYMWHVSGLPVWWSQIRGLFVLAMGRNADGFLPRSAVNKARTESILIVLFYVVMVFYSCVFSTILIMTWILPVFLGQPFLRLYLLAEHGRCPAVVDMFENSRTTYTNRVMRFIAWNMPYHAEHHTYPNVPFHRLPALNQLVSEHLKTTENGYAKFHKSYAGGFGA